jgi:hypothetical protein
MRATRKSAAVKVPPCDLCGQPQAALGAVLYGPPEPYANRVLTEKTHVCVACYDAIFAMTHSR